LALAIDVEVGARVGSWRSTLRLAHGSALAIDIEVGGPGRRARSAPEIGIGTPD
jgi:hypothetical protein